MRNRDRLTSVMLAVGVLHALGFGIGTVAAQQATGTPTDASRELSRSPKRLAYALALAGVLLASWPERPPLPNRQ